MRVISDKTGLTVVTDDGDVLMVSATDVTYPAAKKYLVDERGQDADELRRIITEDKETLQQITDAAVAAVDGDEGDDYRLTHGDPVADTMFETAIRAINADQNPAAIVKFLERLERNPSAESRSQLFAWIKAEGLTITDDGLIVGYKGVSEDYYSISSGKEPVTVTTADGKSEVITGHIPYPIGATVTLPRELVDSNRDAACSVGLHVGTFSYANGFGRITLLVLVDPADVVSVPRDCNDQKVRVTKLVVAREYDADSPITDVVMSVSDDKARQEYLDRPDNASSDEDDAGYGIHDSLDDISDFEDDDEDDDEDGADEQDADEAAEADEQELLTRAVMDAVMEKLQEGPQSNRTLGKRFSKARRAVLTDALERRVASGDIFLNSDNEYQLVS